MSAFYSLKLFVKEQRGALLDRLRYKLKSRGRCFFIGSGVYIRPGALSVGDYSYVGPNSYISCETTMGHFVLIAGFVSIVGGDHRIDRPGFPMQFSGRAGAAPVVIEDDVWVGQGAIILQGVRVGEGSVIGAGSVVTKDIPPYSIAAGVPARVLRPRFEPAETAKHKNVLQAYRTDRRRLPDWKFVNEADSARS